MTKRHDEVFAAVLSGVPRERDTKEKEGRAGARFLKRGNAISDRLSGDNEEKVLHWVDPSQCRMWARHNRDYSLLTEETCRDLIEGIRAQGQQEFPAIVRRLKGEAGYDYEVICGARRHFAVSWLRANNYPQFKYLIEERDLSDEEAFRLADIENRDREDISDYERATDYAFAVDHYYGGTQKAMAERLEVSPVWLSRYLELAKLPSDIILAFPTIRDIKELHARALKPLMRAPGGKDAILKAAHQIMMHQQKARVGEGQIIPAPKVISMLKNAVASAPSKAKPRREYRAKPDGDALVHTPQQRKHRLEFPRSMSQEELEKAFKAFVKETF